MKYRGSNLTTLHQWILVKLYHSDDLWSKQDFLEEWSDNDMVTRSKLDRAFRRLRDVNLVHTHTEHVDNVNNRHKIQLNADGRNLVNGPAELSSPPEREEKDRIEELEEQVEYLKAQTEAQQHYIEQLLSMAEVEGYSIEDWSNPDGN